MHCPLTQRCVKRRPARGVALALHLQSCTMITLAPPSLWGQIEGINQRSNSAPGGQNNWNAQKGYFVHSMHWNWVNITLVKKSENVADVIYGRTLDKNIWLPNLKGGIFLHWPWLFSRRISTTSSRFAVCFYVRPLRTTIASGWGGDSHPPIVKIRR